MIAIDRGTRSAGTGLAKYTTKNESTHATVTPRAAPHMSRVDT